MGCDYYLYTILHVTTKDGKEHALELDKEKRWIFEGSNDDETGAQMFARRMKAEEEQKLLFSEGKWLIKNQDLIDSYESFIVDAKEDRFYKPLDIWLEDIKEITRQKYCIER